MNTINSKLAHLVFDFADVETFTGFAFTPAEGQAMAHHGGYAESADFAHLEPQRVVA